MYKKSIQKMASLFLALILAFSFSIVGYGSNGSQAVLKEYRALFNTRVDSGSAGRLVDSVTIYIDKNGNQQVAGETQTRDWFEKTVTVRYDFYDMGGGSYEVGMTAVSVDPGVFFTRHTMQIKPKNNLKWWTNGAKHEPGHHKTVIGDVMQYNYSNPPSNPTVQVKGTFTLGNFGTFSIPATTLRDPLTP